MALTITKLKMWKDPGYTHRCTEVPPPGSWKLPTPDYVSTTDLRPRKNSTISSIELPLSYCDVFDMSYLYMEFEDSAHHDCQVFGWIENIEQTASSNEAVIIRWTPDWWRTYSGSITWGVGTVTRCNDSNYRRPYPVEPRKWKIKHFEKLAKGLPAPHDTQPWTVNVIYNVTVSGVTTIRTYYWRTNPDYNYGESKVINGTTYHAPGLRHVFNGTIDEKLGLDPDRITGIFITPVDADTTGTNTYTHSASGDNWFCYYTESTSINVSVTYDNTYSSDDNLKTVIVDPNGSIVYTMPWGYSANKCALGVDVGTVGCNIIASLFDTTQTSELGLRNSCKGMLASFPAITAPFNSNAYASYNYSGQRDYDRQMREIQRQQKAVNGVSSIGQQAIGGGIAGASAGPIGAAGGAIAGAASGSAGTAIGWFADGYFNDKLQEESDKLYSNQASSVIQGAGGSGFIDSNIAAGSWYIVQLEADDTSAAEYNAQISRNGYATDITTSVSTFITAGGPIQIRNLNLTGSIPPQAKQYIKGMLEGGIYITENNPSGVVP